jgi:hypothetical protein
MLFYMTFSRKLTLMVAALVVGGFSFEWGYLAGLAQQRQHPAHKHEQELSGVLKSDLSEAPLPELIVAYHDRISAINKTALSERYTYPATEEASLSTAQRVLTTWLPMSKESMYWGAETEIDVGGKPAKLEAVISFEHIEAQSAADLKWTMNTHVIMSGGDRKILIQSGGEAPSFARRDDRCFILNELGQRELQPLFTHLAIELPNLDHPSEIEFLRTSDQKWTRNSQLSWHKLTENEADSFNQRSGLYGLKRFFRMLLG